MPHQCSGRAAGTSGRPSRSVASASRASRTAASSRRRGEASGSTVGAAELANQSRQRQRPSRPSRKLPRRARQARRGTGMAGRPPPRYPPPLSPPAATWLGCTRRRRAVAPQRSESRWERVPSPRGAPADRAPARIRDGVRPAICPPARPQRRPDPTPAPWRDGPSARGPLTRVARTRATGPQGSAGPRLQPGNQSRRGALTPPRSERRSRTGHRWRPDLGWPDGPSRRLAPACCRSLSGQAVCDQSSHSASSAVLPVRIARSQRRNSWARARAASTSGLGGQSSSSS